MDSTAKQVPAKNHELAFSSGLSVSNLLSVKRCRLTQNTNYRWCISPQLHILVFIAILLSYIVCLVKLIIYSKVRVDIAKWYSIIIIHCINLYYVSDNEVHRQREKRRRVTLTWKASGSEREHVRAKDHVLTADPRIVLDVRELREYLQRTVFYIFVVPNEKLKAQMPLIVSFQYLKAAIHLILSVAISIGY